MGHALGNNYGKFYSMLSKPVIVDCNFVVDSTNGNGLGIRSLKGQGVENVFMHTTATPGVGPNGYLNPNPAAGYALIQLAYNYKRYYGGASGIVSPLSGTNLAINGSALTVGTSYVIVSVGHGTAGTATIMPVADVAGSLASKYFLLFDGFGNTWAVWFSVSGVGQRPNLGPAAADGSIGLHYVQQSIVTNDSAATIGADLVVTINGLPSGVNGVFSFTSSGTTTVTVVSNQAPQAPLPGVPEDGVSPLNTGFAFALVDYKSNLQNWQNVGVPKGVVPAVGVAFVATSTGDSTGGGSTGLVQIDITSGVVAIQGVGNANLSLGPIPMGGSPNVGGWILVKFLNGSSAATAPANNSVVGMQFYLEQATEVGGNQE